MLSLYRKEIEKFHSVFTMLLYVGKRTRPDLQVAVTFLGTRTLKADVDDWKKLKKLLAYIIGTLNDRLILHSDNTDIIKWWTDASYGVHEDMKSHTSGVMTLVTGAVYATRRKQRLTTVNSTESELVVTSDALPQALWTSYFLQCQSVIVDDSLFGQDNMSTIKLATNGKLSSGKRTRHIKIRFFFIKDRIKSGYINTVYCHTDRMLANFF